MAARSPTRPQRTISARPDPDRSMHTHRTHEALPAPLRAERLDRAHPVADAPPALLALRHPQAHVARLAVRVPAVHGEPDVVVRELPVAADRDRAAGAARGARGRRREERVAALGAEEVLLVVRALPERLVVERDEPLVHDRRLAVVAPRREDLSPPSPGPGQRQASPCRRVAQKRTSW